MTVAALLLALAVLTGPRGRISRIRPRRRFPRSLRLIAVVSVGIGAALVLPGSVVLAAALAGATGYVRHRSSRRCRVQTEDLAALEAGLEILVGELRVGAHPVRAFAVAAAEVGGPVGHTFGVVAARARLGVSPTPDLRLTGFLAPQWIRICRGWEMAQHHGLAVADLLHANRLDLVERSRFTARVNAGLSGARATAAVLTGLPVVGIGLGQLIGARPLAVLTAGGAGGVLLVIGVALACAGLLWADRITGKALR